MAAVGAVVAVVAHDEVVPLRNHLGAPVVVAAVLARHVLVVERDVVDVHPAVHDADRVAFLRDDPLHERLVGVHRVVEHDDVAAPGRAEPVNQLVDDQPVLVLEGRRHALSFDPRHLEPERHDERGVDRGRCQGADPGQQLFTDHGPAGGAGCGGRARRHGRGGRPRQDGLSRRIGQRRRRVDRCQGAGDFGSPGGHREGSVAYRRR